MSLSRKFAAFVSGLRYEDLPPEVVDRAKGVTLEALASALVGRDMLASRQALALIQEEEAGGGGAATVLCHGNRLTKAGAAFVNGEMILAGGKWDTFRMPADCLGVRRGVRLLATPGKGCGRGATCARIIQAMT
jgi:2-methylcitrate dehydratase PrpD